MDIVVAANIVSLIGYCISTIANSKGKARLIRVQIVSSSIFVISNLMLGGYTGALMNALIVIRNMITAKDKMHGWVKIASFAIIGLTSSLINIKADFQLVNLMPVASVLLMTYILDCKNEKLFKRIQLSTLIPWIFYDFSIRNYVGSAFSFVSLIVGLVGLVHIFKADGTSEKNRKSNQLIFLKLCRNEKC